MNDKEIATYRQQLFEPTVSPGQAFDALFKMRQERVMWEDVCRAVRSEGQLPRFTRPARRIRNQDLELLSEMEGEFECPGCGVSRVNRDYCANPACPQSKPLVEGAQILNQSLDGKFKNPRLTFGQYAGKTLLDVAEINPGYLRWMEREHSAPFWRQQAGLALITLAGNSPHNKDTDDTGFFGG